MIFTIEQSRPLFDAKSNPMAAAVAIRTGAVRRGSYIINWPDYQSWAAFDSQRLWEDIPSLCASAEQLLIDAKRQGFNPSLAPGVCVVTNAAGLPLAHMVVNLLQLQGISAVLAEVNFTAYSYEINGPLFAGWYYLWVGGWWYQYADDRPMNGKHKNPISPRAYMRNAIAGVYGIKHCWYLTYGRGTRIPDGHTNVTSLVVGDWESTIGYYDLAVLRDPLPPA